MIELQNADSGTYRLYMLSEGRDKRRRLCQAYGVQEIFFPTEIKEYINLHNSDKILHAAHCFLVVYCES